MKVTRVVALYGALVADAIVFVIASFSANLLSGPLGLSWSSYLLVAMVVGLGYGWIRWVLMKPDRIRFLASKRLADNLADSAEAYGLDAVYNMQSIADQDRRNSDTLGSIRGARSLRLAANSGASYLSVGLNRHWESVRLRLEERVPFKVVLLDPFCLERKVRNQINVEGEADDSKLALGDIIRASNKYPDLEVRFVQAGMSCTVFITDEVAYFDPYHLAPDGGRITNRFMCLRMGKMVPSQGLSNYEVLSRHFEQLWRISVPLETWMQAHQHELPVLPNLRSHCVESIMR